MSLDRLHFFFSSGTYGWIIYVLISSNPHFIFIIVVHHHPTSMSSLLLWKPASSGRRCGSCVPPLVGKWFEPSQASMSQCHNWKYIPHEVICINVEVDQKTFQSRLQLIYSYQSSIIQCMLLWSSKENHINDEWK